MSNEKLEVKSDYSTVFQFTGTTREEIQKLGQVGFTPDCNGGVDHSHYIELINGAFARYEKKTGKLIDRITNYAFWKSAGISRTGVLIDPRIIFIPDSGVAGQWLAVQLDMGYRAFLATTSDNDPNVRTDLGNWKASELALPGCDFPMLGYDANGIYIVSNTEDKELKARGTQIVFIPREDALRYPPKLDNAKIFPTVPPERYGYYLYPPIDQSKVSRTYATFIGLDPQSKNHLTWLQLGVKLPNNNPTIIATGKIEIEPYKDILRAHQPIDQYLGGSIRPVDGITSAPWRIGNSIWLTHTVRNHSYNCAIRWYHLVENFSTGNLVLSDWGEIKDESYDFDFYNPSIISLGENGPIVINCTRSGYDVTSSNPNDANCGNASAYAAIIDPKNKSHELVKIKHGLENNFLTGNRWGDFSTICMDPDSKSRKVWMINQYVIKGGDKDTANWGNSIAAIDF